MSVEYLNKYVNKLKKKLYMLKLHTDNKLHKMYYHNNGHDKKKYKK